MFSGRMSWSQHGQCSDSSFLVHSLQYVLVSSLGKACRILGNEQISHNAIRPFFVSKGLLLLHGSVPSYPSLILLRAI